MKAVGDLFVNIVNHWEDFQLFLRTYVVLFDLHTFQTANFVQLYHLYYCINTHTHAKRGLWFWLQNCLPNIKEEKWNYVPSHLSLFVLRMGKLESKSFFGPT